MGNIGHEEPTYGWWLKQAFLRRRHPKNGQTFI